MLSQSTYQDNRSPADVSEWLHCEVRALRERMRALEAENEALRGRVSELCARWRVATDIEALRKAVQG